jgi:PTS system nitrogen regulatory IIA component
VAAFARSLRGVDCHSLDGAPTKLFFLLVSPEDAAGIHLKALARVSRLLRDKGFRERLLQARTQAELYRVICEEDAKL